jgi:hypothetical protein
MAIFCNLFALGPMNKELVILLSFLWRIIFLWRITVEKKSADSQFRYIYILNSLILKNKKELSPCL